jgi:hypothetical protein
MKAIIMLFGLYFFLPNVTAQSNDLLIDQEEKMLIFTSVKTDGGYVYKKGIDEWNEKLKGNFNKLEIKKSKLLRFCLPESLDTIRTNYSIQLFEIFDFNSEQQSRFLLKFSDLRNYVWLRVDGYVENDINLLFDYFLKQKIKKKDLKTIVKEWEGADKLFKELTLLCKVEGYLKGNSEFPCFKSVFYIKKNDSVIGIEGPLEKKELNSKFSRIPLYGWFRE